MNVTFSLKELNDSQISNHCYSSRSSVAEHLEDVQEDHDDIEVKDESTDNIVVDGELMTATTADELSVDEKEETVNDYTKAGCEWVPGLSEGEDEH